MAAQELNVSVVVISFNQLELLQRLINQLLNQECQDIAYQIIVVDDSSTDGTAKWLRQIADKRVTYRIQESNVAEVRLEM
jgi:glycosyltransferase involved in cell wall biosynthesis